MFNQLTKRLSYLIIGFSLFFASTTTWAERDYNIELVIFRYTNIEQYNSEHWPSDWQIPNTEESLSLNKIPWKMREQFKKLAANERTLAGVVDSLKKSERYEVLEHLAWRQPGLNKNDAINIKINSGQVYRRIIPAGLAVHLDDTDISTTGSLFIPQENLFTIENTITPSNPRVFEYTALSDAESKDEENPVYELSGNFKIVISRFVHVYTDFLMMLPVSLKLEQTQDTDATTYADTDTDTLKAKPRYKVIFSRPDLAFTTLHGFNIREHRRMRSNELHFIDHPLLGIMVKASHAPVKQDQ